MLCICRCTLCAMPLIYTIQACKLSLVNIGPSMFIFAWAYLIGLITSGGSFNIPNKTTTFRNKMKTTQFSGRYDVQSGRELDPSVQSPVICKASRFGNKIPTCTTFIMQNCYHSISAQIPNWKLSSLNPSPKLCHPPFTSSPNSYNSLSYWHIRHEQNKKARQTDQAAVLISSDNTQPANA